jgi:hypothetical protein
VLDRIGDRQHEVLRKGMTYEDVAKVIGLNPKEAA